MGKFKRIAMVFLALLLLPALLSTVAHAEEANNTTVDVNRIYADGDYTVEITANNSEALLWFTPEYTDSYTLYAPEYASGKWLGQIRLYDSEMNCIESDSNTPGEGVSVTFKLEAGETYIWGVRFYHSNSVGKVTVTLKTNHRPGSSNVITQATCTEAGLKNCTCKVCNRVYEEVIPATHRPQNGVCVDCGHVMDILGSGSCGENVSWLLDETGTMTISGTGAMTDYDEENAAPWQELKDNIIAVVVENGVTSIGENAFYYCTKITSAFIGDDVTEIGDAAFCSCGKLVDLTIGQNVKRIGSDAFSSCVLLYDVQLPAGLQSLSSFAFISCTSIDQIELPASLEYISGSAFWGCGGLKRIIIPYGVTGIGQEAFYGCSGLESITIPASITNISDFAFASCENLKEIFFAGDAPRIGEACLSFVTATCYYPGNNSTWTKNVLRDYGGTITWVPCYEVVDGADSVVGMNSSNNVTIRIDGEYAEFSSVWVDGIEVDPSNYTVTEGSTIVTLASDYLNTLSIGSHAVKIQFKNGAAFTTFTVVEATPGDVNGDNKADYSDALLILRASIGLETLTKEQQQIADVTGDKRADYSDALKILRASIGLETLG